MSMIVYTDSTAYADTLLPPPLRWQPAAEPDDHRLAALLSRLYGDKAYFTAASPAGDLWQYLCIVEHSPSSQYDLVVTLSQENHELPDGTLCLSGASDRLHGQRNRSWAGLPGNIHLTAFMAPMQKIEFFGTGFVVLAAVSVVGAIDAVPDLNGTAGIKWVNDILINGAKVAGVLAHSLSIEGLITGAILGIGLNVESTPQLPPDPYVPAVASLRDFASHPPACDCRLVLGRLLESLEKNYRLLKNDGYRNLLADYKKRSVILGHEVNITSDPIDGPERLLASGKVIDIGENLELFLKGCTSPISRGRLIISP